MCESPTHTHTHTGFCSLMLGFSLVSHWSWVSLSYNKLWVHYWWALWPSEQRASTSLSSEWKKGKIWKLSRNLLNEQWLFCKRKSLLRSQFKCRKDGYHYMGTWAPGWVWYKFLILTFSACKLSWLSLHHTQCAIKHHWGKWWASSWTPPNIYANYFSDKLNEYVPCRCILER